MVFQNIVEVVRGATTTEARAAATMMVCGVEVVVRGVEDSRAKWRGFHGATTATVRGAATTEARGAATAAICGVEVVVSGVEVVVRGVEGFVVRKRRRKQMSSEKNGFADAQWRKMEKKMNSGERMHSETQEKGKGFACLYREHYIGYNYNRSNI